MVWSKVIFSQVAHVFAFNFQIISKCFGSVVQWQKEVVFNVIIISTTDIQQILFLTDLTFFRNV
uniref:Uncharacterized protein n=1 Tax=Anopheles quadriannulatus TaxID=34691 RepID=A0A182XRL1_ANOQN